MLVNLSSKIIDQLLLGYHGLDQPLELGGRNGGLDESGGNKSGSGRSESDRGIDGGTR